MNELPRWRIADLLARYQFEPTMADVFVEGAFDKEVVTECFRKAAVPKRHAYEIDAVDVPDELLATHALTPGRKSRVIALARELAVLGGNKAFRCLVDRDLDHWFGKLEATPRLVWTTYCSIELYFFAEDLLRDILVVAAKSRIEKWDVFFSSFVAVLNELYMLRVAARELKLAPRWPTPFRCCRISDDRVEFDRDEYINRVLIPSGMAGYVGELRDCSNKWLGKCSTDPRDQIRGADLVDLLAWVVNESNGIRTFAAEVTIRRAFLLRISHAMDLINALK